MHYIKKRQFIFNQIDKLSLISFISTISTAVVSTIWAIYLKSFLNNESYVGFLSSFFTIVAMISSVLLIPYIERTSKSKIYSLSLVCYAVSYILFSILSNIFIIIAIGTFISIMGVLKMTSFGIILRDKSKNNSVSKNIGLVFTFINLSWLLGPLIAGFLSEKYGFSSVFLLGAGFQILAFALFFNFKINDKRKEKKIDRESFKLVIEFLKNKNRVLIYVLSAGISFWWALIYIYIPMKIISSGLGKTHVGYFLFGAIFPLVIFEYYFGKKASKEGFKKIFFTGYLILSTLSLSCFFITNLYLMLGILVLASIGVAMLEPTTEAYFFDIISKTQRDKFYSQHYTALNVGHIISTFSCAVILLILPFKFLFLFVCVVTLFLAFLSLRIKNVIEEKRN